MIKSEGRQWRDETKAQSSSWKKANEKLWQKSRFQLFRIHDRINLNVAPTTSLKNGLFFLLLSSDGIDKFVLVMRFSEV